MKKTNIKEIREKSKALFDAVPIAPVNEKFPFVVSHPFTSSNIVQDGKMGFLDLYKKKDYNKWRELIFSFIDKEDDIIGLYYLLNKPYRLVWLKYARYHLSPKDFAKLFADAWVNSENPNNDINVSIDEMIGWYKKVDKKELMDEEDYKVYSTVPDEFVIYRGVSSGRVERGLSWTRSKEKAEWFRDRFLKQGAKEGLLLRAIAKKKDLLAYFNTRNEDEYVIDINNINYEIVV